MQTDDQKFLWRRIQHFAIDDPSASVKYSDKLAFHNHWTDAYTARVIEEYKKFIFLCCVVPGGASPSPAVDEAWHLHLTYTHNYWKDFCPNVLEREIHHFPSKGGIEEKEKHKQWYGNTLKSYQDIFAEEAPGDIWPPVTVGLKNDSGNDIKDKPGNRQWYKKREYLLIIPFFVNLILFQNVNPYALTGPQFLFFYFALMVAVVILLVTAASRKKEYITQLLEDQYDSSADIYQLSRFIFGKEKSKRAAIIELAAKNILEPGKGGKFTFYPSRYSYTITESSPILSGLLKNFREGEVISYGNLTYYYDEEATYNPGLAALYKLLPAKDPWGVLVSVMTILMGIVSVFQGVQNERPVFFLVFFLGAFSIAAIILISRSAGTNILERIFLNTYSKGELETQLRLTPTANMFVFGGLIAISGLVGFSHLRDTFARHSPRTDSGSSGCGSPGCGSSGCSGGCSGGGCGGCGGGD